MVRDKQRPCHDRVGEPVHLREAQAAHRLQPILEGLARQAAERRRVGGGYARPAGIAPCASSAAGGPEGGEEGDAASPASMSVASKCQ